MNEHQPYAEERYVEATQATHAAPAHFEVDLDRPLKPRDWWRENPEGGSLAPYLQKKLAENGLHTVRDVINAGEERLREIPGLGNVAISEIKMWLRGLLDRG